MKCQKCERPATFHITELTSGKPQELHLCEDHAREYLTDASEQAEESSPGMAASLAQNMAQQLALGQAAQDLKDLDQQECPVCGISFFEFRSRGRLGCPNDYQCFQEQLEPLILNIHGESDHVGKTPKRAGKDVDRRTQLIRLRREMDEAIAYEDYERASDLRDKIRQIESET
jgi:protein arginine kinase activator